MVGRAAELRYETLPQNGEGGSAAATSAISEGRRLHVQHDDITTACGAIMYSVLYTAPLSGAHTRWWYAYFALMHVVRANTRATCRNLCHALLLRHHLQPYFPCGMASLYNPPTPPRLTSLMLGQPAAFSSPLSASLPRTLNSASSIQTSPPSF